MKKKINVIIKIIPLIVIIGLMLFWIISGKDLNIADIMSLIPQNMFLAALMILALYAVKSLSILFPILLLQISTGLIFPLYTALLINCLGTVIAYSIPYIIGRFSGSSLADQLTKKYPKAQEFIDIQRDSDSFISFILRAVSCLPADIVSLYLGSIKIRYVPYAVWGLIGTLPGLIPATVAGAKITDPTSTAFIVSVILTVLSSVGSIIIYRIYKKRKSTKAFSAAPDLNRQGGRHK